MKLKKKPVAGRCYANRCTATDDLVVVGSAELCPRHANEPIEAPAPATSGTAALVPVEVQAEVVAPIEAEAIQLRDGLVGKLQIVDDAGLATAGELAAYLAGRKRATEAQRKRVTAHLVAAKREIDAWFRPAVGAFDAALKAVHNGISDYRMRQADAKRAALAAGDHDAAMAVQDVALPAGTHERKRVCWRVTDPAKVPATYWAIDATKVQAAVDAGGLATEIPGIETYEDSTLVTRRS